MKLTIGTYEVEVKAHNYWKTRNNEQDTKDFLNHISLLMMKAAEMYAKEGYNGSYDMTDRESTEIYDFLNNLGYYDECRK